MNVQLKWSGSFFNIFYRVELSEQNLFIKLLELSERKNTFFVASKARQGHYDTLRACICSSSNIYEEPKDRGT